MINIRQKLYLCKKIDMRLLYFSTSFFIFFFSALSVLAQPKPCGTPAVMSSFCKDACIICDIDGFTGINNSNLKGEAPKGFCTTTVHNAQWIAFMAGSTNLTLEVSVFNCKSTGGESGLEVGIYKSIDCKTFELMSNCDGDIPENTKQTFKNTKPLVIGQYYYFVMDGNGGDICNYTIKVLSGTTKVNQLPNSGVISGDFEVCEGSKYKFKNAGVLGAIDYEWTLNGVAVGKGLEITVDLPKAGTYNLCCTASNVCDKAAPSCQTILVKQPITTTVEKSICKGNCVKIVDSTFCKSGNYKVVTTAANGCDSTILVKVVEYQATNDTIALNFCEGDTVFIANKFFTKAGNYTQKLQTIHGCDSVLTILLTEIKCNIKSKDIITDVKCNGENNGKIEAQVTVGTPPFKYQWQSLNDTTLVGKGIITSINTAFVINNLPVGNYFITITDDFGNKKIIQSVISQPDSLKIFTNIKNLLCAGDKNGSVIASVEGGAPPYTFLWNNGDTDNALANLNANQYFLTVTDKNGCIITASPKVSSPDSVLFTAKFQNPSCDGLSTGKIIVENLKGGTPPYTYLLNDQPFTDLNKLQNLTEGNYKLNIVDDIGCPSKNIATGALKAPKIPVISLGEAQIIKLGEPIYLNINTNTPLDSIVWAKIVGLSCYDCPSPLANPSKPTIYQVKVTSEDGCATKAAIQIFINPNRKIFVPNAFSPDNNDGINDRLTIFAAPSVRKINYFKIFDRWGNLVFEQNNFLPNDLNFGWDGIYKNAAQNSNTFTWIASIEFLDDEVGIYTGDSMILK
jgi:gliding motility-associated-like protein